MNDNNNDDIIQPQESAQPNMPGTQSGEKSMYRLGGMYRDWFLEYASYVILERAVPDINDGLKPVQRRILHAMKTIDDGSFIKVSNIVGNTMQYHPHGDASITDALVQLGQKDLLVEKQGNWGNILTGASAAAGRYIEARLSNFALDVLYNPKVTDWTLSYDGRKKEPVTLPSKFPLLLAQGSEGIAVGLSSKVLPHNFNEIIDAAIAYLKEEPFMLLPDFPTGGMIDVSKYNDGKRGGSVKIRAKIEKVDNKSLAITELPFSKTSGTLIESIIKAQEKGKIKIRKVDDLTSGEARIMVYLQPGTSSDKAIDALYAFTDCEVSISPNCCVIDNDKPAFLGVSDVLKHSVDNTRKILGQELQLRLDELGESLLYATLEKIFIENGIYKDVEYEEAENLEDAITHIDTRIRKLVKDPYRPIVRDDIVRLLEIKMKRILKFNADEANNTIAGYLADIDKTKKLLNALTQYTIDWFENIKKKYGADYPRRTIVRGFDNIEATNVAEANEKLYINREEGFIGTALKKDEYLRPCSSIDDIIIFYKDGRYKVVRVQDKLYVGTGILHIDVFKRNDLRTIYNVIYQNGKGGIYYMKRFAVNGITRDREYNVTQGTPGSKIVWFTANPNGEAEVVKVTLKPKLRLKTLQFDVDFSKLAIKGRSALGNMVTKNEVHRFSLKEKGTSTLGGRMVWFDPDVLRLNYEGRGTELGEFQGNDLVLVILKDGTYYTSSFDASNHYEDNIAVIEKYDANKVWTVILNDADQKFPYLKRFRFEPTNKRTSFLGENPASTIIAMSDQNGAQFTVTFGGVDDFREPLTIIARDFVGVKSLKAKGKRLTTFTLESVLEIDPVETPESEDDVETEDVETQIEDVEVEPEKSDEEIRDEINGQKRLFE